MTAKQAALALIAAIFAMISVRAADAADLALKRVLLSTGGVGYFEYEATVDGPGDLGLTEIGRAHV